MCSLILIICILFNIFVAFQGSFNFLSVLNLIVAAFDVLILGIINWKIK